MSTSSDPVPGQPFDPYRRFQIVCVPAPLQASSLVSSGAKLCYARLTYHRHRNTGQCNPGVTIPAAELGKHPRQVIRYPHGLRETGLIQRRRVGPGDANEYLFLWHPIFDGAKPLTDKEVTSLSPKEKIRREDLSSNEGAARERRQCRPHWPGLSPCKDRVITR